jgi:predicted PurR-regulated permease PerM
MKNQTLIKVALSMFIGALIILILILGKFFLIPLAVAFFFGYLLYPVTWQIEKRGVHRGISIFIVILLAVAVLASIGLFVGIKVSNATIDFTALKEQVTTKLASFQGTLEDKLGMRSHAMDQAISRASENIFSSWESKVGAYFSKTTTTLFQIFILPVFTFFVMFYRTKTAYFIFRLVGRKNKPTALRILRQVSDVTVKYLGGILIVVLILAVLNTTGLLIIGVPNAIIFGVMAAFLNLIPYIGTFIGGLIPILYVLFSIDDPFSMVVKIAILFAIVQFIENNLLTPNIVGNNIKINPLAIIIGLLLANLIWGIAGMLIVVPVMAILKIVMRNIPELQPFAYLLSDRGTEKHRIKFTWFTKKWKQIFKKS